MKMSSPLSLRAAWPAAAVLLSVSALLAVAPTRAQPQSHSPDEHARHMAAQAARAAASAASANRATGPAAQAGHAGHGGHVAHGMPPDTRQAVRFPAMLRAHTLANMRDHLLALAEIQGALGRGAWEQAGQIAEQRLGMSSLEAHGAHDVAGFMPPGMQDAGTAMHRSASRFALEAQNSSASGDARPALAALATLTQACVACHAGYRFE